MDEKTTSDIDTPTYDDGQEDPPWIGEPEKDKNVKSTKLSLKDITEELYKVSDRLSEVIPKLNKLEDEYYRRYYKLLLQAGESTQAAREASARLQLRMPTPEGEPSIYDDYQDLKTDVRVLLTRKEMLIEISRNLRSMS